MDVLLFPEFSGESDATEARNSAGRTRNDCTDHFLFGVGPSALCDDLLLTLDTESSINIRTSKTSG